MIGYLLRYKQTNSAYITSLAIHLENMRKYQKISKSFKFICETSSTLLSEEMGEYVFKYTNMLCKNDSPDFTKHIQNNFLLMNTLKKRYITKTNETYNSLPEERMKNTIMKFITNIENQNKIYKYSKKIKRLNREDDIDKIDLLGIIDDYIILKKIKEKMNYYQNDNNNILLDKYLSYLEEKDIENE